MQSFSKKVKEQLLDVELKKKCCRYTDNALAELASHKKEDLGEELRAIDTACRCEGCHVVFIRRLFLLYGTVTDPEKSYHLELGFHHRAACDAAEDTLGAMDFAFRRTMRGEKHILYLKDSSLIEDFLVAIGASAAAFDVMNSKIIHEFRNSVNRQVNCDTANIEKQVAAGKKYVDAIASLYASGRIDALPEDLRETARLRYENHQMSLTELGIQHNPPVSKSGIRHRLERILAFSEER